MMIRLAMLLLLASLVACDSKTPATSSSSDTTSAPPPAPRAADGTVTAKDGGKVGDDAGASVTVPAGAVKKDARIEVTPATPDTHVAPTVRVVSRVWSFRVDGKDRFSFSKRVRVAVPLDKSLMAEGLPVELSVWQKDAWKPVEGSRVEGSHVVADVNHFSDYAATQDVTHTPAELEELRNRFFKSEFWYGHVQIEIRGSGSQSDSLSRSSFAISRTASIDFRLSVSTERAAAEAMVKEMKKAGIKIPSDAAGAYEKIRNYEHWSSGSIKRTPEDETKYHVAVNDGTESAGSGDSRTGPWVYRDTATANHDDRAQIYHQLEIDVARGTYDLSVGTVDAGTLAMTHTDRGKQDPVRSKSLSVRVHLDKQPLPGGTTLSGIKRLPREAVDSVLEGLPASFGYGTVSGTISWTLSPVPSEDVELVLKPDGYEDWLPRGGRDGKTAGNTITMTASLRKRGGGATRTKMQRLEVRFQEVSSEPGVCLNRPLENGGTTPDLKFAARSEGTLKNNDLLLQKDGEFTDVNMTIECFDWGAYGTIKAWSRLSDGRMAYATLDGDPSEDEVRLPKRKRESKVADKWKSDMAAQGEDDEDSDKQQGNRNDGDGLTLYEEYRGLIAKGTHTREHPAGTDGAKPLTPKKKDLILHNRFKSEAVIRKGLDLLEKASGIQVVEVDDGELPDSRRVNVNAGHITVTEQHALILEDASMPGAVGFAEGKVGARFAPDPTVSPKGFLRVTISLSKEKTNYELFAQEARKQGITIPYTLEEAIITTVAHETAHGLGVRHHGYDGDADPRVTEVTDGMQDWFVYDRNGAPMARPVVISGKRSVAKGTEGVGAPGNSSSGDVNCIMCYVNVYNWSYHDGRVSRALYRVPVIRNGRNFCTSGDGTGYNKQYTLKDGRTSPGLFGHAGKDGGNCLGQMCVRDPK
jgi:hypothetical protein